MSGSSTALFFVGLFFVGGVISFVKQGMPKALIVLVSIGAVLSLGAAVLRLEVWS
jgi:hypothetical protein